jgi:alginate O-acetyltransferase complex protein AlgI
MDAGRRRVSFSSITFLFYFMPVFFAFYYLLPCRNTVILIGSLAFYAWGEVRFIPLLLAYILANWAFGLMIARRHPWPKLMLLGGLIFNLGMLVYYKYLDFLLVQIAGLTLPPSRLALPLGISFFSFQGISYLVDVHRGRVPAQRNLLTFAMYKAMFPQLVAGPIVRYAQVARRLHDRPISAVRVRTGLVLFLFGLAQKVLIADTVAVTADAAFALPSAQLTMAIAWAGALCYTLQIAFDFGGYSTMAIGLGHMMGFAFPANFNRPYAARSVTEFWRRWHMTLSQWFRDYLYVPVGGNRHGAARTYVNLASVFLLCGLWHGAAWNFIAWGAWHGLFLVLERAWGQQRAGVRFISHAYLLLVVIFGWVLFRAGGIGHAAAYLGAMLGGGAGDSLLNPVEAMLPASTLAAMLTGAAISVIAWPSERVLRNHLRRWTGGKRRFGDAVASLATLALAIGLGGLSTRSLASGTYSPFIYFRF